VHNKGIYEEVEDFPKLAKWGMDMVVVSTSCDGKNSYRKIEYSQDSNYYNSNYTIKRCK
jgi:hypothetical protein